MHKDNTDKYSNIFNNVNSIFKKVNNFWKYEKNRNDKGKEKTIQNEGLKINEERFEKEEKLYIICSQFNQNTRDGCKAKKKIIIGNYSQLSTSQSFKSSNTNKQNLLNEN
jgi:hypothetical protein